MLLEVVNLKCVFVCVRWYARLFLWFTKKTKEKKSVKAETAL